MEEKIATFKEEFLISQSDIGVILKIEDLFFYFKMPTLYYVQDWTEVQEFFIRITLNVS